MKEADPISMSLSGDTDCYHLGILISLSSLQDKELKGLRQEDGWGLLTSSLAKKI